MTIIVETTSAEGLRTFQELQDEVLSHGFNANIYRPYVKIWLNEGLNRLARNLRVLQTTTTLLFAAGDDSALVPAGLRIQSLQDQTNGRFLVPWDNTTYDANLGGQLNPQAGNPQAFTVRGASVVLDRPVNTDREFQVVGWGTVGAFVNGDDTVATLGLLPEIDGYLHVVVDWALYKSYRRQDDAEMAAFYFAEFNREAGLMKADLAMRVAPFKRQIGEANMSDSPGPRFQFPGR